MKAIIYFTILSVVILFSPLVNAQNAVEITATDNRPAIISAVSTQLTSITNKYGRVSITKVIPLSIYTNKDAEKSFYMGISFLTQEDVIISPGIGAGFQF